MRRRLSVALALSGNPKVRWFVLWFFFEMNLEGRLLPQVHYVYVVFIVVERLSWPDGRVTDTHRRSWFSWTSRLRILEHDVTVPNMILRWQQRRGTMRLPKTKQARSWSARRCRLHFVERVPSLGYWSCSPLLFVRKHVVCGWIYHFSPRSSRQTGRERGTVER